jgi:hypothetical protein
MQSQVQWGWDSHTQILGFSRTFAEKSNLPRFRSTQAKAGACSVFVMHQNDVLLSSRE